MSRPRRIGRQRTIYVSWRRLLSAGIIYGRNDTRTRLEVACLSSPRNPPPCRGEDRPQRRNRNALPRHIIPLDRYPSYVRWRFKIS